jgi:hypothetical protein
MEVHTTYYIHIVMRIRRFLWINSIRMFSFIFERVRQQNNTIHYGVYVMSFITSTVLGNRNKLDMNSDSAGQCFLHLRSMQNFHLSFNLSFNTLNISHCYNQGDYFLAYNYFINSLHKIKYRQTVSKHILNWSTVHGLFWNRNNAIIYMCMT